MKRFEEYLPVILSYEGGFVHHPADPGGATNRGITQRVYDRFLSVAGLPPAGVQSITGSHVSSIYRREYWLAAGCDRLPAGADFALFDFAVNSGVSRSVRYLQFVCGCKQDGVIGPLTVAAVLERGSSEVSARLCDARLSFLKGLSVFSTFGNGWSRRVADVAEISVDLASIDVQKN